MRNLSTTSVQSYWQELEKIAATRKELRNRLGIRLRDPSTAEMPLVRQGIEGQRQMGMPTLAASKLKIPEGPVPALANHPTGIAMKSKTAVIILGNPKYIKGNDDAINFYKGLKGYLEDLGYSVTFDKGEPHTEPPKADLWVGHSRGADRLRFAPEGVKVLGIGANTAKSLGYTVINHPNDSAVLGGPPNQYHFTLTGEMKDWLSEIPS